MRKGIQLIMCIVFCLSTLLASIGYAAISNDLSVMGKVLKPEMVYNEIVITNITALSSTSVDSETHSRQIPTSVKSTITGNGGQQIVYKITAHNYSDTESYIYQGMVYGEGFENVASKLSISASADDAGAQRLPNDLDSNYVEGSPIEPGDDFVFYVTYDLNGNISSGDILVSYVFNTVKYTITYVSDNDIYAIDCITDNERAYTVRATGPDNGKLVFSDWVNANASPVDSYPKLNTRSYTLYAKWDSVYMILFTDEYGSLLYQENFTSSATKLSDEGQATVDQIMAELQAEAAPKKLAVSWSDYTIKGANKDITVRAVYTYNGNLRYTPIDRDSDGIIDYYRLDAVSTLDPVTEILGNLNGRDVEVINKLYKNEDNFDFGSGVTTVIINEGTKTINHNALAYTSDLNTVYLPNSITRLEKNVFSRNTSNDKKAVTIYFNGTVDEWEKVSKHEDWHNGLRTGSKVICTDGYYDLKVTGIAFLGLEKYTWTANRNK